ncbi:hypothetical protein [Christiangramia sediminis]|uniref:Uncharacterized protein n=1 Tax=Christiangramia sediminis TaxID=2881336 RepID=A0A9X1RZ54_9FLAO|nr:hypothetical protein [Christiangramia sediminis]MCB7482542.1 hypothetical protein [Christiangramia sediminis]
MNFFETRIVRTWEPSIWLRVILTVLLLASAGVVYVWKPDVSWLMNISYGVYMISLFLALSQSFFKPKYLGNLSVSEERIRVDLHGEQKEFPISELEQLGFNYRGYSSFWKHSIYGNKNHFYFMVSSGEKFDYEIVLQNKEVKEEFKLLLKRIQNTSYLKIAQTGNSTF